MCPHATVYVSSGGGGGRGLTEDSRRRLKPSLTKEKKQRTSAGKYNEN